MIDLSITPDQQKMLDSFICERISTDENNKSLIETFKYKDGKCLGGYLEKDAFAEDSAKTNAVYFIKNSEGVPFFYFSIKCGMLSDKIIENEARQNLLKAISFSRMQLLSVKKQKVPIEKKNSFVTTVKNLKNILRHFWDEISGKKGKSIRVNKTYSGIELAHFCKNENMNAAWKHLFPNSSMGETFFWHFIVPKIMDVQVILGCQYLYLYAADLSEDASLIAFYKKLKFEEQNDLLSNKPSYDNLCSFLCQDIVGLKDKRADFFNTFNQYKDKNAV